MSRSTGNATNYYQLGFSKAERVPLDGDAVYDAIVIGGGYAGISAATAFAQSGKSVIVLEKGIVGSGASGQNGGIFLLSEGTHLGDADEARIVDESLGNTAKEFVQLIEETGIDADLRYGSIRLALTKRQAAGLQKSANTGSAEMRATRKYLNREELEAHLLSDRYEGGLFEPNNINLNPYKLLEGLARRAEKLGVVIAEQTEVIGVVTERDQIDVTTGSGRVAGRRLVVAAGASLGEIVPSHKNRLLNVYSQIAVTESIDTKTLQEVLPEWHSFSEIAVFSRYFRRLPENRLLFGIGTIFNSIAGAALEPQIRLELRDTFPSLGNVPFQSAWQGTIATTVEETPLLDPIGESAIVTSSNGVLASWNAGRIAARATEPEYREYDILRGKKHTTWPPLGIPEPIVRRSATLLFKAKDRL